MSCSPGDSDAISRPQQHENDHFDVVELFDMTTSTAPSVSTSRYNVSRGDVNDDVSLLRTFRQDSRTPPKDATASRVVESSVFHAPTAQTGKRRTKRLEGWRYGVTLATCTALAVMLVNLVLIITAAVKFRDTIKDGSLMLIELRVPPQSVFPEAFANSLSSHLVGTSYQGECNAVDEWSTTLHIVINVLSTSLLSASNYTMQCLCSPTRKEIDVAHGKGDWLDIGLPSMRNIAGRINVQRIICWWILVVSSAPIHLLYNSSSFKTIDAVRYDAVVVNRDFLNAQPFSTNVTIHYRGQTFWYDYPAKSYPEFRSIQLFFSNHWSNSSAVQRLSNSDCMTAYNTPFVSGRSNVLLVSSAHGSHGNNTLLYVSRWQDYRDPEDLPLRNEWICHIDTGQSCDVQTARKNSQNWTVDGYKIDYCLSQLVRPHCRLQFSLAILGAVIVMNFCKCGSMFWTLYFQRSPTLVTVGDAVASFLDLPDATTQGRCLSSAAALKRGPLRWKMKGSIQSNIRPPALAYDASTRCRWFTAASTRRWAISMSLCISTLIVAGALFGAGRQYLLSNFDEHDPFALGFGKVDPRATINGGLPKNLLGIVLVANFPQAVLSFLYLMYNGLLTSMLLSNEWSRYYLRTKGLRTTVPHGSQRSTYWLQLPYRFSIPLLMASATLHWLVSQSIFLTKIDTWHNENFEGSSSRVGYSLLPLLLVISLSITILSAALLLGCRKLSSPMPVAGSCSAAISAACHRPQRDSDASSLPVSWGEVDLNDVSADVYHCCFTSLPTRKLVPGRLYAGEMRGTDMS